MQIDDVAQAAGVRPSTITSYAARGQMPAAVRCPCCGSGSVWRRTDIDAWIARRRPRAQIAKAASDDDTAQ
jgi:predicted DNA-binding transcriptional regulator AlpA